MPTTIDGSNTRTRLRKKAEALLEAGTAPPASQAAVGVDALRLLHQLSSKPGSAEDALKLLHELQVHQVELDLQHEEIAANEQALVEDLSLYRDLYDSAPLGYFLLDREGVVMQANPAAAELFGIAQDHLTGKPIDSFLAADSRPQVLALLQGVAQGGAGDSCLARAGGGARTSRRLLLLASRLSQRDSVLLACCEYPGAG